MHKTKRKSSLKLGGQTTLTNEDLHHNQGRTNLRLAVQFLATSV
jgi:hypothetical protein